MPGVAGRSLDHPSQRADPYPLKAYYSGHGDPNLASSFVAGLKPLGRIAPAQTGGGHAASAADLQALVTETEKAYVASGLPPKNVTDRIAKGLRRRLYLSGQSRQEIAAALDRLLAEQPTLIAKPALQSVRAEYD